MDGRKDEINQISAGRIAQCNANYIIIENYYSLAEGSGLYYHIHYVTCLEGPANTELINTTKS